MFSATSGDQSTADSRFNSPASPPTDQNWRRLYSNALAVTDFLVVVWAVVAAHLVWFGLDSAEVNVTATTDQLAISYLIVSVILIAAWTVILGVYSTRDYRVVGAGTAEYKRVADSSVRLFGLVAIASFLLKIDLARGYILLAFPLGIGALWLTRWLWRQWLGTQRSKGLFSSKLLLVGSEKTATHIAAQLARFPSAGYHVVGAWLSDGTESNTLPGTEIRVVRSGVPVLDAMVEVGADTAAITSEDALSPQGLRELSWSLTPGQQHLIVAPSLTDVGGPRIHMRPVAGLPLIHIETPRYEGIALFSKRAFDLVVSSTLLVVLSPMLLFIAVAVRLTSAGPVLYRQERVGLNGQHFHMLKFRSMRVNADAQLAELLKKQGTEGVPLFKLKDDPRVTPVGRILRKYSLDEFPQLINVLRGDMSLVGPRPQRDAEVALYDQMAMRRLLLKPGMSGLWQVSGRSNLSWDDSIRLDLYYVENWSLTADFAILWRTFRAVLFPGASAH